MSPLSADAIKSG
jgi:hypothetical protein